LTSSKKAGNDYETIPLRAGENDMTHEELAAHTTLPEFCYAASAGEGVLSRIERGLSGHCPIDRFSSQEGAEKAAKHLNQRIGVTAEQAQAMVVGSMFGWHVPGARVLRKATATTGR
jgi:hypothetical protein